MSAAAVVLFKSLHVTLNMLYVTDKSHEWTSLNHRKIVDCNSGSLQDLALVMLLHLMSSDDSHIFFCLRMLEIGDLPTFIPHFKLKCCLISIFVDFL